MLVIRREQLEVFDRLARAAFADEMAAHAANFAPKLCQVLGDTQVLIVVQRAIARAQSHGLTLRGPIRLCVEMTFLFGSAFDTDPQYPWARAILDTRDPEMARAEELYTKILEFQEYVSGPNASNTRAALRNLEVLARQRTSCPANEVEPRVIGEINRIFPQKAAFIGDAGMRALIAEASTEATKHALPAGDGDALIAVLMFSFGHGCTDDPLYPWIERTLTDERIGDGARRTERLRRKSLTWLEHVVSEIGEQAPA